jgi:hypothetical protein
MLLPLVARHKKTHYNGGFGINRWTSRHYQCPGPLTIYSKLKGLSMVSTNIYSLDQLVNQYNQLEQTSTTASLEACKIQAMAYNALKEKYQGNTNSKEYKKEARHWSRSTNKTPRQCQRDAEVGQWLLEPTNDPSQYKTKTDIYKALHPSKPKTPAKPKAPTTPTTIDPYWKECERKWMALMDFMGTDADRILAKALAKYTT